MQHLQCKSELGFELCPWHNGVEESVFEHKLSTLKTVGQILANRLLDNARPRKPNQCIGFTDVQVAKHGE